MRTDGEQICAHLHRHVHEERLRLGGALIGIPGNCCWKFFLKYFSVPPAHKTTSRCDE